MANDKKPSIPLCISKDNAFNNVQLSLLMDGGCGEQEGRLWVDFTVWHWINESPFWTRRMRDEGRDGEEWQEGR